MAVVVVAEPRLGAVRAAALAWLAVAAASARENVAYRATVAASVLSNVVMTVLRGYLALAVWQARPGLAGYSTASALTFVVVGQALMTTFAVFGGAGADVLLRRRAAADDLPRDVRGHQLPGSRVITRLHPHTNRAAAAWDHVAMIEVEGVIKSFVLRKRAGRLRRARRRAGRSRSLV